MTRKSGKATTSKPRARLSPDADPLPQLSPRESRVSGPRRTLGIAAGLVAMGFVLRLAGLGSDLWLDELWSIRVANDMRSPWDAFGLHHEINHYLNTIWLFFLGQDANPVGMRLLAFLAGVSSVGVAGLIGARRSIAAGSFAMLLTAFSYELVLYSSEARGYSTMVFAAFLAFYCLERFLEQPSRGLMLAYWAAALLGMLSHPTFAAFIASAITWSLMRARSVGAGRAIRQAAAIHSVPALVVVALYLVDLRFVVAGGGTPTHSLIDAYGGSLAWALGTPAGPLPMLIWCIAAIIALDIGLRRGRTEGSDDWVFLVGVILVYPIILIALRGSDLVYTRHFLVGSAFVVLLLAFTLGRWWEDGRKRRCLAVAVVFCLANGWQIVTLARFGKGQYSKAVADMVANTRGPIVTIGGDQDFRVGFQLSRYLPQALATKEAKYFDQGSWPEGGPEWVVMQRESFESAVPSQNLGEPFASRYELAGVYPSAPLAGLHWFVYHQKPIQ